MSVLGKSAKYLTAPALLFALAVSTASSQEQASAPEPETVQLRATVPIASRVDRFIAENAQEIELTTEMRQAIRDLKPEEIAEQRCGTVRSGYFAAFVAANSEIGIQLRRGVPIGAAAEHLRIPPCLFRARIPNADLRVNGDGDLPSREALTGAPPDGVSLQSAGRFVTAPLRGTLQLGRGRLLGRSDVSVPVAVEPVGMSAEAFLDGVEEASGEEGAVRPEPDRQGYIVTSAAASDCVPNQATFAPSDLQRLYAFARMRAQESNSELGTVGVVIVDNGFYGVRTNAAAPDAWANSPFPPYLFRRSNNGALDRTLAPDRGYPVHEGDPNDTSGHGTHVAGLALGGPEIVPVSTGMFDPDGDGQPWMRVTILNVARDDDSRRLPSTAMADLRGALNFPAGPRVINMSFAYDGRDQLAIINQILDGDVRRQDLFIAAAGNDAVDVTARPTLPAAQGGVERDNLITVAAHDGVFRLASFSNYGANGVDIAAPGCQLRSWIGRMPATTPLSGTSMAAPAVTFAAALLASLKSDVTPDVLKRRIVIGGDLLVGEGADDIAFRVRLNPLRALATMFDDVLERVDEPGVLYVGAVREIRGFRCGRTAATSQTTWALKRQGDGFWLYQGRNASRLDRPCAARLAEDGRVRFSPEYRIAPGAEPERLSGEVRSYAPLEITGLARREP